MTSLTLFNNDGLELVIDIKTGEAFATQAGYSRMSNIEYATVRKRVSRLKGSDTNTLRIAEMQTPGGLQAVTLLPADLVFDWLLEDDIALARVMGKAGATVYMHQLAGFDTPRSKDTGILHSTSQLALTGFPQLA